MTDHTKLECYTDVERISMTAVWADGAYTELGKALHAGEFRNARPEYLAMLGGLCDGLLFVSAQLNALNLPYPPPRVRSGLRLVEP